MTDKINLTASNLKYLIAIYKLSMNDDGVLSVDVVEKLGVTKPSAHKMINTLCDMALVTKEKYGTVSLTHKGKCIAKTYSKYSDVLKQYLKTDLCMSDENISNVAYLILSGVTNDKLENMCSSIQNKINGSEKDVSGRKDRENSAF